jgi:HEAT repeat protein
LDALGALVKIGTLAVEPLIAVLKDGDKNARQVAAAVLGRIGDARAVEPLIVALEDVNVCSAAARALAQIGDVRAVEPLITVLKGGRRIDARQAAAEALDSLGWNPDYGEDGTWYWIAKRDWGKCVAIGTAAVEPLITALKHRDSTVREAAAEALGRIGDARAVEPLIATLNDYNANLRRVAVQALENLGDKRAVEPLIAVLKDEGRDVRQKAAEALERFAWQPDMSETGAVYWIAKREWDKCVELGAPAVGPLIAALRDRDSTVREASVEALVKLGTPAVESLRTATLPSSDWAVRRAAASALERLGMPIPEAKPLSAAEEEQALSVLRRLCDAYATNDKAKIAKLEPLARQIGEEADWRGGLKEMRRLFEKLGGRRGSRTLEMHWGGIGDWRG